ncbi:type IV secretory system conjugative DNA transfer family protein [Salmonella enterica subsp. enterica serovar Agona]|nr:type IV secretory system conjugative DNA transfer family protein [Salmonella enterica subsp. enterica serovar Agona]
MALTAALFPPGVSHADPFTRCTPASAADEWARRKCDAENATYDAWAGKLAVLENGAAALEAATNAGDWTAWRTQWEALRPVLDELGATVQTHRQAAGAGELVSLYGADLGFYLQNAGLGSTASLDDFSAKILAALDGPRAAQAGTAGVNLVRQAATRGVAFVRGLAAEAAGQVETARRADLDARGKQRQEELSGSTRRGYVDGFGLRFAEIRTAWLVLLVLVLVAGGVMSTANRGSIRAGVVAAGIAYLVPGLLLIPVFVFLPFVPAWLLFVATLAGSVAMYFAGGRVFALLGLGRLGAYLDSLRRHTPGPAVPASLGAAASPAAPDQITHGSARFGTPAEIAQHGHLARPGQRDGLTLARVPNAPAGLDPRFRYIGHVVTVAPNGSGKGIGQVIPNLLDYPGSCLVLDVKGENAAVTARARRELGHAVHVVDPFGVTGQPSAGFNVLDRIDLGTPDCVSESAILADALVIAGGKNQEGADHWDESAKNLLQGVMLHVAGLDAGRRHLGELRRLLTQDEAGTLELLADMASDEAAAYGLPARAANTLMGMSDRERGSVLSTARRNTAFLDDPRIVAALSRSDFDLSAIKSELMTVYLVMPANRIGPNARFLRLFIGSVLTAITSSATQPPYRVAFVLDEFAQLGYMKAIEDAVSLMRGYGLAFWVFLQDLSQLKGVYPRWQTFLANSAKVFFGTDDYDTAKYVSDSLGKATIEYETANTGRNSSTGIGGPGASLNRGKSSGSSQQIGGRELLTPDEVMRLGPERPLVLVKGEYPYLLARLNYLADREYAGRADPNPYHA